MSETILLADDDVKMKTIVSDVLHHEGFTMLTALNGRDALKMHEECDIDLVLLDIRLPDIDGVELLRQFVAKKPDVPVIMISGFATIDRAVATTKIGAYDFLEKPLEPQRVLLTIKNALEKKRLQKNQQVLIDDMMQRYGVVGVSDAQRSVYAAAARVAKLDTPVLITGENGTGKELLATVLHRFSGRSPLICVNSAAVPRELIESELFGHKRGSFTGAISDKIGKFQAASGGTLFLDEIGDMYPDMQAKILRALETKEICQIGGNDMITVDVRIIAATNKNLLEEIRQKTFREDLYYRLRGVTFHVPALRERREDIQPLASHFLTQFCSERSLEPRRLTDDAVRILEDQPWRGNVRELKHFIQTLAIFANDETIDQLQVLALLNSMSAQRYAGEVIPEEASFESSTQAFEKSLIAQALKETDGNITRAAVKLHIDRATLSKKIKRLGLKPSA